MDEKMKEKIDFLKRYTGMHVGKQDVEIKIFQPYEISSIPPNLVPENWYHIFEIRETAQRINEMLKVWKKHLPNELSITISYLEDNLMDVELMKMENRYSILYSVRAENGEIAYYEGGNPLEPLNNPDLETCWNKVPESIRYFYENLHNGYYHYACGAMGMVESRHISYFGNGDEWGILEDLEEPLQIDLSSTFGFFSNFMGTYVAIDLDHCDLESATIWSAKDQPDYNVNFWDVVDEWTTIGMQY